MTTEVVGANAVRRSFIFSMLYDAMAIASLPMYDLAPAATRDWWRGLARHLAAAGVADVPAALTNPDVTDAHWRSPDLLFSQTCGYPLTHALAGVLRLIATPRYDTPGCDGADYCSFVVVAADSQARDMDDLLGARCAINSRDSQSGCNALRALIAPLAGDAPFFAAAITSGEHRNSVAMVRDGRADVAAIDCVVHGLLARHHPAALKGTRILCRTAAAPAPPFVTALGRGPDTVQRLRDGLAAALADPALAETRTALLLGGCEVLPLAAYDRILAMERGAAQALLAAT